MERNWVEEESRAVVMKIGILYFYRDKSEMSKGMALSTRFLVLNTGWLGENVFSKVFGALAFLQRTF